MFCLCRFINNLVLLFPKPTGPTDLFSYFGVNVHGFAISSTAERVFKLSLAGTSSVSAVITILNKTSK